MPVTTEMAVVQAYVDKIDTALAEFATFDLISATMTGQATKAMAVRIQCLNWRMPTNTPAPRKNQ